MMKEFFIIFVIDLFRWSDGYLVVPPTSPTSMYLITNKNII